MQKVAHVKAIPEALKIILTPQDVKAIHNVDPLKPLFPVDFLFNFRGNQSYRLGLTDADNHHIQMAVRIGRPSEQVRY